MRKCLTIKLVTSRGLELVTTIMQRSLTLPIITFASSKEHHVFIIATLAEVCMLLHMVKLYSYIVKYFDIYFHVSLCAKRPSALDSVSEKELICMCFVYTSSVPMKETVLQKLFCPDLKE